MKIALVLGANVWFSPYVSIYTRFFEKKGVDYDIISWNRDGSNEGNISYDAPVLSTTSNLKKLQFLLSYILFVIKTIKRNKYDKLVVFTPQIAIPLSFFLMKHYKRNYIFDFRDLSIEQNKTFSLLFKRVLKHSYANVISSPGFKQCLPSEYNYIISHNFNEDEVKRCISTTPPFIRINTQIIILTIGGIRDYTSNVEVIKALANNSNILLRFIGKGDAAPLLHDFVEKNGIKNVEFEGYYPKEKEKDYILESTFLNIFYPRRLSHDTALSNRFYNSLIYKKPMIVTHGTIQGNYAEKYNVGISLSDCKELNNKIRVWQEHNNYEDYCVRCNLLLKEFLRDYDKFHSMLNSFCNS